MTALPPSSRGIAQLQCSGLVNEMTAICTDLNVTVLSMLIWSRAAALIDGCLQIAGVIAKIVSYRMVD